MMSQRTRVGELIVLGDLPIVGAGDDIGRCIKEAMARGGIALAPGDIVVIAQKIVSKAEGRAVRLADLTPSARALELAEVTGKDPRLVEAVLGESTAVLRAVPTVLIVEHRLGHVMANAGIDQSNVEGNAERDEWMLLLPLDPDASAEAVRRRLDPDGNLEIGVIVSDSFGRPWRNGTTGVALGIATVPAVVDQRGDPDIHGRPLQSTETGFADSVAAAAVLMMGEGAERSPVVIVRGVRWRPARQTSRDLLRDVSRDLFR